MAVLYVELGAAPNPDVRSDDWRGYASIPMRRVKVRSFEHASNLARGFIERNMLGSGNWIGGTITDSHGKHVAKVSYNGRIWAEDGSEIVPKATRPRRSR